MTWADYRPIPGTTWADPARVPGQRGAARRAGRRRLPRPAVRHHAAEAVGSCSAIRRSTRFARAGRAAVLRRLLGQARHRSTTATRSTSTGWSSPTAGSASTFDAFGPYRMPQQALRVRPQRIGGQAGACPAGSTCNGPLEPDADALWTAAAGADISRSTTSSCASTPATTRLGVAGVRRDEVPDQGGHPGRVGQAGHDHARLGADALRAVDLVAGRRAAVGSSRQCGRGRAPGTITHEIAHTAFRIGDNNNNPYATPYHRVGSGPWDVMDRGSFNGPGGPHRRWVVPATRARSMPAGSMLRNRHSYEWHHRRRRCCGSPATAWPPPGWSSPRSRPARSIPSPASSRASA